MIKIKNTLANFASKCLNTYKDYATTLNNINEELGLQNKVASLSNYAVADELTYTIRKIAYANREPNHETICKYLKQAIEDLASGMDATDVLGKYDEILFDLRNPKHRGYRAKILIVDDLYDIDKEELKDIIKEKNMVKLHCDRCDKEIAGEYYYTISIYKEDINPKRTLTDCADALSSMASSWQDNLLSKLKAQKMYCEDCKNEIEKFISNKE